MLGESEEWGLTRGNDGLPDMPGSIRDGLWRSGGAFFWSGEATTGVITRSEFFQQQILSFELSLCENESTAKRRSEIAIRAEINVYISIGCSRFSAANP